MTERWEVSTFGGKTVYALDENHTKRKVAVFNSSDDAALAVGVPSETSPVIHHNSGEYVVGAVHTNTIEGFWSIFKRGIIGTFHKVSPKYLPLYVAEFQFRYNNRNNQNIFGEAIRGC